MSKINLLTCVHLSAPAIPDSCLPLGMTPDQNETKLVAVQPGKLFLYYLYSQYEKKNYNFCRGEMEGVLLRVNFVVHYHYLVLYIFFLNFCMKFLFFLVFFFFNSETLWYWYFMALYGYFFLSYM